MHDEFDQQRVNDEAVLAAALRALNTSPPPRDGWERVVVRVRRRSRVRATLSIAVPAALAAGIALVLGLPHRSPAPAAHVAQRSFAKHATAPAPDADALRAQSQRLQNWVRTLDRSGAPLNGDTLANAVALQDRIGLVDLQLSAATDPVIRASLWQQRIGLLQQLGLLHLQPYAVADTRPAPAPTLIL